MGLGVGAKWTVWSEFWDSVTSRAHYVRWSNSMRETMTGGSRHRSRPSSSDGQSVNLGRADDVGSANQTAM